MAAELLTDASRALDANANPYSGAKWFFYQSGTSTPQSVYTTAALSTTHSNPVEADAGGKFAPIYFDSSLQYRGVLKSADEVTTIYDIDPINSGVMAQLAQAGGSALLGFLQAGTGATARTAQAKMRDIVSVKDFGATGDGTTDDTAAMQAAHNTGNIVYYPKGTYKFTSQITIAAGGIRGDGKTLTILNCTDTSSNAAIKFTGPFTTLAGGLVSGIPTFQDFTLNGNDLKTTGAGLQFNSATNEVSYALLQGLQITYFPIGVDFINASLWKIIGCDFGGHTVAGVRINNTYDNDAGDSVITGSVFNSVSTTAPHILHLTSGGLKVIGNKMLGGGYGYRMEYTGTTDTSVLVITGNSIENFSQAAISLTKTSVGLTSFKNISIADNEIAVSLATPTAFLISTDSNTWLQSVTITGNTFQLPGVTNSYGVAMANVTALMIEGNTFRGNGGTSLAITLTSCVDAKIGSNVYSNITTPYEFVTPGANNVITLDSQSGSTTMANTGWSAYYGSLYISPVKTITFDKPFKVTPQASDVTLTPGSGDGTLTCVVDSISKTQLAFVAIAWRTDFAAAVNWKVEGVL